MATENRDILLTLYKYRSLAEPRGRKFAIDVIKNNRMWWQSPLSFNDPFDCNPVVVFGQSDRDRKAFAKRAANRALPGESRHVRRVQAKEALRRSVPQHEAHMKDVLREGMAGSAVTCFSEVNDSPLMWAHYADSHRGVCFIFREQMVPTPWISFAVTYSSERPRLDVTDMVDARVFDDVVLNKSADWAYEREHRMMQYRGAPGYRRFPPAALVGVVYGARISNEDRSFIDALLSERSGLERYDASIDERCFHLNIERSQR